MNNKIASVVRFMTGAYTPFLSPLWGKDEEQTVFAWFKGTRYDDAPILLQQEVVSSMEYQGHVLALNLGRSAIQVALESMNLPLGSEVLLPSFSCTGVVMPVLQAGLKPVFVDVDEQFNSRFESIIEADGPNVRAVIVPHLSGCWAQDLENILEWAKDRRIFVIEDAAQAQGLTYHGKPAGTFGDVGIFSTHMGKLIHGSGGGWLVSDNPEIIHSLYQRTFNTEPEASVNRRIKCFVSNYMQSLKAQGMRRTKDAIAGVISRKIIKAETRDCSVEDYRFPLYKMSDIEAQLVLIQMKKVSQIIRKRKDNADRWRHLLRELNLEEINLLPEQNNVHAKMLVSFAGKKAKEMADFFKASLFNCGVETESSYIPLHLRMPFCDLRRTSMPYTEKQYKGVFAVPVRPNLEVEDWRRITSALTSIRRKQTR